MAKAKPFKHLAHVTPFAEQPIVFFTVVMHNRRGLLDNPVAHETLDGLWKESADRNGWSVGDYLLMPDHVHLFARASRNADPMRAWLKMWKSVSARRLVAEFGSAPPIWQEEYFDRYLRSADNYSEKWDYVRNNPVRAGLVEDPDDWPYKGKVSTIQF